MLPLVVGAVSHCICVMGAFTKKTKPMCHSHRFCCIYGCVCFAYIFVC